MSKEKVKLSLLNEEEKLTFLLKKIDKISKEKGEKGDKWYTPVKGKDYFDGESGYTPIKGIDYKDGEDGYTPIKNVDYFDGKKGEDGHTPNKKELKEIIIPLIPEPIKGDKGDDGKDAEIKDIIKELKKKQYLEPKDIKGMPLNMNDMRWHGGGISKVVHDATMTGDGTVASPLSSVASGSTGAIISATDSGNQQDYNLAKAPTSSNYYVIMNNGSYTTDDLVYGFSVVGTVLIFNNVLTPDVSGSIIKLICI